MTLTGTAAAINTALSTASYTGNSGFHGSDTLTATTTDGGGVSSARSRLRSRLRIRAAITETLTGAQPHRARGDLFGGTCGRGCDESRVTR